MNKRDKIQNEIDKTLGLFDKKKSLPPNPFFYTRVQQKINEKSSKTFSLTSVVRPALLAVLLVLNVSTAIWYTSSDSKSNSEVSNMELADVLKSDFNLEYNKTENLIFE